MPEAKEGDWGQAPALGDEDSLLLLMEKRTEGQGRNRHCEAHTASKGASTWYVKNNRVIGQPLCLFAFGKIYKGRVFALTPHSPTKITCPGLRSTRKYISCCLYEIFEKYWKS